MGIEEDFERDKGGNNIIAISKIKRSNRNTYAQERLKDYKSGL